MNIYIRFILFLSLLALPASYSAAEDISCELKENDNKEIQNSSSNEYTKNKSWRFKLENILADENDTMNKKLNTNDKTKITVINDI